MILSIFHEKYYIPIFLKGIINFYTAGHPVDAAERNKGLEYARQITVGNDLWFGAGGYNFDRSIIDRKLVKIRVICGVHSGRKRRAFTEE